MHKGSSYKHYKYEEYSKKKSSHVDWDEWKLEGAI